MRILLLFLLFFIAIFCSAQKKKPVPVLSFGVDYRMYPIDIEDVPRGPLPRDNGLPSSDFKFWQPVNLHGRLGYRVPSNWILSLALYGRYNEFHRTQGINYVTYLPEKPKTKKNFKMDLFIDVEKKFRIKKNKDRYMFILGGFGFTNINSRWNVIITDTGFNSPYTKHYKGTHFHIGPRLSLGYQYNSIKFSIDGYIIEDPIKANLTSLWLGTTMSYEISLKKKAPTTEMNKPEPVNYYKQSVTRKKIGLSLLAPTALLFLLGRTNLDVNSPNYGNDRSGFTFAGVVTGGTSLYCLISSRHQLKKAERKNNNPVY